ncbi:MAG TPA: orotidine-5'-phosphate decarboxylase [Gammaproteobacteria bacterium]|nr:orotidine-5'-phosphate decarboxylase [Gammaproteobacteria bacterium]
MATAVTRPERRIANRERLIFALDVPDLDGARELVTRLGESVVFYKIGLELATSRHYFELLDWLVARDKKVFTDLKLYDIPATVTAAVRQLSRSGASFLTVHGDRAIMEAAAAAKGAQLKILVVTVLTSIAPQDLAEMGIGLSVEELVLLRARQAVAAGCDGVIASGLEAEPLRKALGPQPLIVTPGIRPADGARAHAGRDAGGPATQARAGMPAGEQRREQLPGLVADDQRRVVTPTIAFRSGADHIVVGRPIRDAADPYAAATAIQQEIAGVFG